MRLGMLVASFTLLGACGGKRSTPTTEPPASNRVALPWFDGAQNQTEIANSFVTKLRDLTGKRYTIETGAVVLSADKRTLTVDELVLTSKRARVKVDRLVLFSRPVVTYTGSGDANDQFVILWTVPLKGSTGAYQYSMRKSGNESAAWSDIRYFANSGKVKHQPVLGAQNGYAEFLQTWKP